MKNPYQIREVSTLSFNERVLQEAEDERNPLLERLRFLGIFSSNMDEFFKVRVASIHRRIELGKKGMIEVLELVSDKSRELDDRFREAYASIVKALADVNINFVTEHDLQNRPDGLGLWVAEYFRSKIVQHLVPIIVDENNPFPQLIDGALYFAVKMTGKRIRYAILEMPPTLPRFVHLPTDDIMYIDDVIRYCLNDVFYIFEYEKIEAFEFKVSRDAELDIDNDFSEGYVRKMERVLRQRKGGRPTRLVCDEAMPAGMQKMLLDSLGVSVDDTLIAGGRYHNMKDLINFPVFQPGLTYDSLEPLKHPVLDRARSAMFSLVEKHDLMVTYPYQSFDHVVRLLREAAIDPAVTEIKITLYRTVSRGQIVNALINAARNGKRVFVAIELQARFDEKTNIDISQRLQEEGATVVFGVPPMKVHAKLMLVERNKVKLAGLSTGNFNENNAKTYVDSTLFTIDTRLTGEVAKIFDVLERASYMRILSQPQFKHLLVSPFNSRNGFLKLLVREQAKGKKGYVMMKVNHLTDDKVIARVREAADAGVEMDFVVRTTYAATPHKNIRAISILDRFLEHQRVYIFGRGSDRVVYMSSSDLMERNLDWRVEVAFPIYDKKLQQEVVDVMELQVHDNMKARILDEKQSNKYVKCKGKERRGQEETYRYLKKLAQKID
jgi:polyphosphate kinase